MGVDRVRILVEGYSVRWWYIGVFVFWFLRCKDIYGVVRVFEWIIWCIEEFRFNWIGDEI